jgi:hypothetical protein
MAAPLSTSIEPLPRPLAGHVLHVVGGASPEQTVVGSQHLGRVVDISGVIDGLHLSFPRVWDGHGRPRYDAPLRRY